MAFGWCILFNKSFALRFTMIKLFRLHSRLTIIIGFLIVVILLLSRCISHVDKPPLITNNKGEYFAGSASCAGCHKNIYDSCVLTAHYLSSRLADSHSIKGSFEQGKNVFIFGDAIVAMEKNDSGFYQNEYARRFENYTTRYEQINSKRFDIVIGSNTKGQSYLYWNMKRLYQLPISYFTVTKSWCNSPGYPYAAVYNRSVTARCLECHSTYAKIIGNQDKIPEQLNSNQIIYGITCEKCHGAAAKHVAYQIQHPEATTAKYIINTAKLSQQQNLDLCALCHSGSSLHKTKPSFSFTAGKDIVNNFTMDSTPIDARNVDVHGNQYGLLRASQCFKKSEEMTCNTCHNTHHEERGNIILFSQRCLSCHNTQEAVACPLTARLSTTVINQNCIDCHMPLIASKSISVSLPGDTLTKSANVRSHYISVYSEETDKILALIKKAKQNHH